MTLATFVQALTALSVTGVRKVLLAPPQRIGAADMPLMYPRLPEFSDMSFTALGGGDVQAEASVELVFILAPTGLDTRGQVFADAVTLIDSLCTAIAGMSGNSVNNWTVRLDTESYGDETSYTVVVARVEGSW